MVTTDRWQCAQEYERGYWQQFAERIADGSVSQMDWYRWRAEQLAARLAAAGLAPLADGTARVVEVGCGPIGVASFFPAAERVAVDPLEEFYGAHPVLSALRDPAVSYRVGTGERLPCESGRFDLAIIENCIDHVQAPHAVLREIARVLRPDGVLYLTVNCRTAVGFAVHRVLSRLRLDPGHPHTFTGRRLDAMLRMHAYHPVQRELGSYAAALREDLTAGEPRALAKALLGTSEFVATVIARRVPAAQPAPAPAHAGR